MSFKPPCPVTLDKVTIDVQELEPILRPPESKLLQKAYPPRLLPLPDGGRMVVRMAKREEIPVILKATRSLLDVEKDFYDVVSGHGSWITPKLLLSRMSMSGFIMAGKKANPFTFAF